MCESVWRQAEYSDTYILDFYSSLSPVCLCRDIRAGGCRGQGWESRAVQSICKLRGLGTDTCTWSILFVLEMETKVHEDNIKTICQMLTHDN